MCEWTAEEWEYELRYRKMRRTKSTVLHNPGCDTSICGGVFRCRRCRRLVGWCQGGCDPDERGGYCADCWVEVSCPRCDGVLRKQGYPAKAGRCDKLCEARPCAT
jgi:hypothetical protein